MNKAAALSTVRYPSELRPRLVRTTALGLACLLLTALFLPDARAQSAGAQFDRYTPADGLSHGTIWAIWQDQDGFMWFATEDGLNRFDGGRFMVYRNNPADSTSLSDSWTTSLAEDEEGRLWVATNSGGLNYLDPETGSFQRLPYGDDLAEKGLLDGDVGTIVFDNTDHLWVGTVDGGLSRYSPENGSFTHFRSGEENAAGLTSSNIWRLYRDHLGDLWIATWAGGLVHLDIRTGVFTPYRSRRDDPRTLSSDRVRAIYEDREGTIWVGTSGGGLNRFDRATGTFTRYKHDAGDDRTLSSNVVWSLLEDKLGNLWVGTLGGGMNKFSPRTGTFTHYRHDPDDPYSLPSDAVGALYEDRAGLLWIGTDRGVATFDPVRERITHYYHSPQDPASLSHNDVLAVTPSRRQPGIAWVGTNRGGLNRLDLATGQAQRLSIAPQEDRLGNVISAVAEGPDGTLWVGTKGAGLYAYNPGTGGHTVYRHDPDNPDGLSHDAIGALLVDRRGTLWAGTIGRGLDEFDPRTGTFYHHRSRPADPSTLSGESITALLEARDGTFWVGTADGGINRLDPLTGRALRFSHNPADPTSLSHDQVNDLYEDAQGRLWVATYRGLNRFDPESETFIRYTTADGLAGNIIFGLDGTLDGVLWITTSRGLTRFEPGQGRFINYGLAAGLPAAPFHTNTLARMPTGTLLAGGPYGLFAFPPGLLERPVYQPPLVLTAFRKLNEVAATNLTGTPTLHLTHSDAHFSFDFSLLDYAAPEEHTFRYKLEGFDADWHTIQGPVASAHYSNFERRDGTYKLRVEGTDNVGRTSTLMATVVITPPWWRARWFRMTSLFGAIVLLGSALAYGFWRRQEEQAEQRRMRSQGRERERHFLARELHDVPLQNLYSIRHKLELVARASASGQDADLEGARSLIEQTSEDLRRICGELRPPTIGPFGLSKAIRAHLRTFQHLNPALSVAFDLADDGQRLPETKRLALFRIYQNAMANIVRHAEASHIWVLLELDDTHVRLQVRDDGRGFSVPKSWLDLARQQHYGLLGIAEWAEAAGGQLTVQSAPGEGTVLQVEAPLEAPAWYAQLYQAMAHRLIERLSTLPQAAR